MLNNFAPNLQEIEMLWNLIITNFSSNCFIFQRLPEEDTSPAALAAADKRTEQFLMVLDENMKSKNPVWKVMGIEEVEQRQKRRKELLLKREAAKPSNTSFSE